MSSFTVTNTSGRIHNCNREFTAVVVDAVDLPDALTHSAQTNGAAITARIEKDLGRHPVNGHDWFGLPYGCHVAETAAGILQNGWPEGSELMRKLEREASTLDFPPPVSIRRRQVWSDDGDELDNDRYYAGRFEDMWRGARRQASLSQQVISIVVPWGGTAEKDVESLQWNGLGVMLLSDILEEAGYSTEIIGASGVTLYSKPITFRYVVAKRAGEPLALDVIAATLAHPAIFRAFGITMNWQAKHSMSSASGATDAPNDYLQVCAEQGLIPFADVVMKNAYSKRAALDAVRTALEQLAGAGITQTL